MVHLDYKRTLNQDICRRRGEKTAVTGKPNRAVLGPYGPKDHVVVRATVVTLQLRHLNVTKANVLKQIFNIYAHKCVSKSNDAHCFGTVRYTRRNMMQNA